MCHKPYEGQLCTALELFGGFHEGTHRCSPTVPSYWFIISHHYSRPLVPRCLLRFLAEGQLLGGTDSKIFDKVRGWMAMSQLLGPTSPRWLSYARMITSGWCIELERALT